jgi:hypothetical protein
LAAGPEQGGALPDPLLRFVELVDRGEFWESHEALEAAWREQGSEFYHGLILYASAFVHARRENRHGILAQLEKAEAALEPYSPAYLGVDVEALLGHARRCRELVEGHERPPGPSWEDAVPFPRLEPDVERVRGDEPELGAS